MVRLHQDLGLFGVRGALSASYARIYTPGDADGVVMTVAEAWFWQAAVWKAS